MASSMSTELQKTFENTWDYEMNQQLKEMFQAKASKERLDVVISLMACKPKPEASICAFVLEMKGYFDRLESLNMVFDTDHSINIIISGLPVDYNQFVLSYQINGKETSIMKLHSLLQTTKQWIKKSDVPSTSAALVLTVGYNAKKRKTSHSNWKRKATQRNFDRRSKRKVEYEILPTIDPKEVVCFCCNTKGHWKCSCPKYLKDLKDGKVEKGGHSGTCERGKGLLVLVHTDVCGPFQSATKDEKRYYVTFTDDFSRYGYVYLIKHKSDTFEVFKRYQNEVENQLGRKIKVLRSDRGGEYLSIEFFDHLKNRGIVSQLTPPRTPQRNGVAGKRHRTLLDMLEEKCSREMISKEDSGREIDLEEIQEFADEEPIVNTDTQQEVVTPVEPDDISLPIRRTSSKVNKPSQDPQFYYEIHIEEDKISDSTLTEFNEPANYKEAMVSPEAAKWKEAMKSEI
uniref:Retrotransposon protein, putative, Ty1-copia subclass n=1 Tax=Tanacetum cinerariifolium TaxID=118510 RepID=A0A6L2L4V3_TANCI|nr:retrotransposon protein, putative, Ty1-copia subclass [Tanacetum cinerariifolium]